MSPTETMRERRAAKKQELDELLAGPTAEKRDLTSDESTQFDFLVEEIRKTDERIDELTEQERREAAAAETRKLAGASEPRAHVTDAPVYRRNNTTGSYFRDLYQAQMKGDADAAERLRRNSKQAADDIAKRSDAELRALGNTGAAGGSGGEFAPPVWMVEDFVALARPGRKFIDSVGTRVLPEGISSVNIPKVTGGTTTAIQTTQNSALSQTDMTTGSINGTIVTIGGKQVVSQQLLDQSGIPFDEIVLEDLAADYARQIDLQYISGSGLSGQLNGVYTYFNATGTVNVTYTQATPAVGGAGGLYSKIFAAASAVESARFLPPDTVWMHPRRWNWILSSSDAQNRPLVNPTATAYNVVATSDGVNLAQGVVGQIGSLQVVTDANIPTNLGAGTNQDPVFVGIRGDLRVWESALRLETFREPYADSAGVLFRALAYASAIQSRYTTSVAVVNGTGTIAPTF